MKSVVCSERGCPAIVIRTPTNRGRCPLHERPGGPVNPYSNDGHKAWRQQVLLRDPICQHCQSALATEADHIVPIAEDRSLQYVVANGQGLCKPCHSRKTMQESNLKRRLSKI